MKKITIAALMAGAREVVACDTDPLARQATYANLALNGLSCSVEGDWATLSGVFELIVVADVLYDRENLGFLEQFLQRATRVLVADSRVKDFDVPPYKLIHEAQSSTWPDLAESGIEGLPFTRAEWIYVLKNEHCKCFEDLIRRRFPIVLLTVLTEEIKDSLFNDANEILSEAGLELIRR